MLLEVFVLAERVRRYLMFASEYDGIERATVAGDAYYILVETAGIERRGIGVYHQKCDCVLINAVND